MIVLSRIDDRLIHGQVVVGWGQPRPLVLSVDHRDRIWFVETHPDPNRLVGFDPDSETFFSVNPIPGGAGAVRRRGGVDVELPVRGTRLGRTFARARQDREERERETREERPGHGRDLVPSVPLYPTHGQTG